MDEIWVHCLAEYLEDCLIRALLPFQIKIRTYLKNSYTYQPYVINFETPSCRKNTKPDGFFGAFTNPFINIIVRENRKARHGCPCPMKVRLN